MEERMDARLRERLRQIQQADREEGKPRPPLWVFLLLLVLGGLIYGVRTVFSTKRGPSIYLQVRTSPPVKDTLFYVKLRDLGPEAPEQKGLEVEVYAPTQNEEASPQGRPTWMGFMGKPTEVPPGLYVIYFRSNPSVPLARIPLSPAMDGQVVDTLIPICLVNVLLPSEAQMFYEQRPVECSANPCPFPRKGVLQILRSGQLPYTVQVNGRSQKSVIDLATCEETLAILFPGQDRSRKASSREEKPAGSESSTPAPQGGSPTRPRLPDLTQVLETGDVAGMARLLDEGVISLRYRDKNGLSLLHLAALANQPELIRFLVQEGLSVDVQDSRGNTPLHHAAYYGKLQAVQTLLALGADLNARNIHRGETPLFSAIRGRQTAVVRYLLQRGARVDLVNAEGLSPVHVVACCAMGATDILDLLVQAGADLQAGTKKALRNVPAGATALDVAEAFGNTLVAQALSRYGVRRGAYGGRP